MGVVGQGFNRRRRNSPYQKGRIFGFRGRTGRKNRSQNLDYIIRVMNVLNDNCKTREENKPFRRTKCAGTWLGECFTGWHFFDGNNNETGGTYA